MDPGITNLNRVERSGACYRAHRLYAKGCCFATAILAILHLVGYPILRCLLRVAGLLGAASLSCWCGVPIEVLYQNVLFPGDK
jgi:hypothetical protein